MSLNINTISLLIIIFISVIVGIGTNILTSLLSSLYGERLERLRSPRVRIVIALVVTVATLLIVVFSTRLTNLDQSENVITVRVTSEADGSPVSNAEVLLFSSGRVVNSFTDSNGIVNFVAETSGDTRALLIIDSEGYAIYEQAIQMVDNQAISIRLQNKESHLANVIIRVVDTLDNSFIVGAEVILITDGDIFTQATDNNGISIFELPFSDGKIEADISISTSNYEIERQRVSLLPNQVQDARLDPDTGEIFISEVFPNNVPTIIPTTNSNSILFGQTVSNAISVPGETDIFTFIANVDETVVLKVTRLSGDFCPEIRLYDPDSNLLESVRSFPGCTIAEITMPISQDGQYTIIIDDDSVTGTLIGEYNLQLQNLR